MPYTADEAWKNASLLLGLIGDAVTEDSAGGTKIVLSEWLNIAKEVGLQVVEDITD